MFKYRFEFTGDFHRTKCEKGKIYDDLNYYNYQIEVLIPINYDTKSEAERCPCSLRFEIEDGHIVLKIYSDWKQGKDENGNWYEYVDGTVIDVIKWEEYWKYRMSRSKYFSNSYLIADACSDYVPDATPWDELFDLKNLPNGWRNTVESLAYDIHILEFEGNE